MYMYGPFTIAIFNILCYARLPTQFRVNNGYTHVQYFMYCMYHIVPTFLGNSCASSVKGLDQRHSIRDRATVVHPVLAYSNTNMFRRLPFVSTLKSRGVLEKNSYYFLTDRTKHTSRGK